MSRPRGRRDDGPPLADEPSIFRNRNFLSLWISTSVAQTVNTALQFVLLILVVERTNSSIAGSGLIIALAAPPVVFGLISGVAIDRVDKRSVLAATAALRALATALLVVGDVSVASVYAIAFVTATMGQFALPAANAALPVFVPRDRLLAANSAFQFTTTTTQLVGMVVLAPLMLKALGFEASYILSGALLLFAALLVLRLPPIPPSTRPGVETWRQRVGQVRRDLGEAWQLVKHDRLTALSMLQLSTGGMLLFMFALLVPRFVQDILGQSADNSVFVFWPTGLGALLALRLLPRLGRRYWPSDLATAGLIGLMLSIAAFAAMDFFVDFLQDQRPFGVLGPDQVGGDTLLLAVTLVFAFPLGVAYALVNAPAQTVLHERAPATMRGRLFSAQLMVANGVSMLALLLVGGIADATGVEVALFVVAGFTLFMVLVSLAFRRPESPLRNDVASGSSPS